MMHIFSTPYSQDVGKVYLSPEGRGPKFYNIHCTDSHDKDECYIVLKIAKMWNNHRNVTIALGGQRLTFDKAHKVISCVDQRCEFPSLAKRY